MEAHSPYTKPENWAEYSYLIPKIVDQAKCRGQPPTWAQEIWRAAYPQHAAYAAEAAARIAAKLAQEAHVIVTSDHGEQLYEGVFHGFPPNDEQALVPLAATFPLKIQGVISLTETPQIIRQLVEGQTPTAGRKYAKTEYHETPRRHRCAKHQKTARIYTAKKAQTIDLTQHN